MNHKICIVLVSACLILASVIALAPAACAITRYTDLSQLDDNATYTKEDMLAMYDFGYSVGYQDAASDRDTTRSNTGKTGASTGTNTSTFDYVLNTHTNKFHYSSCGSVKDIKPENMGYLTGTRDEAIAQGYLPCGRCKP